MAKIVGNYKIPFDANGNQLGWASTVPEPWRKVEWVDNYEFADILTYVSYERGRSAAHMIMKRSDGKTVQVFLRDFETMIPHMEKGRITGIFTFTKSGQNYGAKLVRTELTPDDKLNVAFKALFTKP